MDLSNLLTEVRKYSQPILVGGLAVLLGGIFASLILETAVWWSWILIGLGLAVLLLFLAANLTEMKAAGMRRTTQARASLLLVAVAMVGILVALNYILSRHPVRFDLTSNKRYTLAVQTLDALAQLKQDVNASMFITKKRQTGTEAEVFRAQQLLEEYAKKSTHFHFKVVDTDKEVAEAKRMGIHEYNTVVFENGENRKDVLPRDYVTYAFNGRRPMPKFQGEGAFTEALLRMSDTAHPVFYLTQGHGERELASPEPDGLKTFKDMLERQNYTVKTLNLLSGTKIPEDATALAVLGPSRAFPPAEAQAIRDYLKRGGKLILCLDPLDNVTHQMITATGLEPILRDFGIKFGNDVVVDTTSYYFPDVSQVVPQYSSHEIVAKLSESRISTVMPFSRSVQKAKPELSNVTQSVFLQTTDKGWGEVNLKEKPLKYDAGADTKGPASLAMACEWAPPELAGKKSRVVVYGSSSFLTNQFVRVLADLDLGLNAFSWAAEDEKKISVHPKEEDVRPLNLSNVGFNLIKCLTVVLMPLSVLVAGGLIWYRRRSL